MSKTVRVSTAEFRSNVRPFVTEARRGKTVIITRFGADDFIIVPCKTSGLPPVSSKPVDPAEYTKIDVNEPAFGSWNESVD